MRSSQLLTVCLLLASLVSTLSGAQVALVDQGRSIYLQDGAGALVDFSGAPTNLRVGGGSLDISWDDSTGSLFSHNSSVLFRNDGSGWTSFANLTALGFNTGSIGSLAIDLAGRIAVTDAARRIFLMNQSGLLVDFSGAPNPAAIGSGSLDLSWDVGTGALFSHNGSVLYRNDGGGWTSFADLNALGFIPGTAGSVAAGPGGLIAVSDGGRRIFLLNQSGALVDFSGAPTSSAVGSGSLDLAWDPISGDLFSHNGSRLYRNDGTGWISNSDLTALGLAAGTEGALAISSIPEPSLSLFVAAALAMVGLRRQRS